MGYVLIAPDQSVIVVDGGKTSDSSFLAKLIRHYGGVVHHWLLTHPHDDHIGAFSHIVTKQQKDIKINNVHGSLPPYQWVKENSGRRFKDFKLLQNALEISKVKFNPTHPGQIIYLDGVTIEVLSGINTEITRNAINNSSIVFRIHDFHKSILFLGDLGVQGGRKLLKSSFKEKLKSDYVQMAHHGQRGVEKKFYEQINPIGCFWPTPQWLYDNNAGPGVNSGKWDTINVRQWMAEQEIKKHYVAATGLHSVI